MIYPLIMLDPKLCKEARYNNLETRGTANRAALIMGLDPKTIRQIEKGTHATRYKKAKIYADAVGVGLAYLTIDEQAKYLFSKHEQKPILESSNDKFNQNFDSIFGKKDDEIKFKDSIKLGLSPSTSVEWWDCRKPELVEKIRN